MSDSWKKFLSFFVFTQCDDCIKTCGDDEQICYVIDNNGYIIISEQNITDTGRFFGEVEQPVMEAMVNVDIFKRITIYDLQGLCKNVTEAKDPDDPNTSTGLITVS